MDATLYVLAKINISTAREQNKDFASEDVTLFPCGKRIHCALHVKVARY